LKFDLFVDADRYCTHVDVQFDATKREATEIPSREIICNASTKRGSTQHQLFFLSDWFSLSTNHTKHMAPSMDRFIKYIYLLLKKKRNV